MSVPDYRIRFPSARIDFTTEVGLTGQEHDAYPLAGGQARYDHMRLFLIGLLAQQASLSEPTQYREGTPWFDLNTFTLKIRRGNSWVSYAEAIPLTAPNTDGEVVTLAGWYESVQDILTNLAPEIVFSGNCTDDDTDSITLPESIRTGVHSDSRAFVHINGSLVDPRYCSFVGNPATGIRLSNVTLSSGDLFTVSIRRIAGSTFITTSVVVP